jgi:hypothetical protein
MQSPSSDDAHDGSFCVWPSSRNERTHQSLFTLLLEIERGLRSGARNDSLLQTRRGKLAASKIYKRPEVENLSRCIESFKCWDSSTQNIVGMQSAHVSDRRSIRPLRLFGVVELSIAAAYISE